MEAQVNLYLISQEDVRGYDTFDSAVVAAESEEQARTIHPQYNEWAGEEVSFIPKPEADVLLYDTWTNDPTQVSVKLLGTALPGTKVSVICSSFNAG